MRTNNWTENGWKNGWCNESVWNQKIKLKLKPPKIVEPYYTWLKSNLIKPSPYTSEFHYCRSFSCVSLVNVNKFSGCRYLWISLFKTKQISISLKFVYVSWHQINELVDWCGIKALKCQTFTTLFCQILPKWPLYLQLWVSTLVGNSCLFSKYNPK